MLNIIHTADWHIGQNFYGYDRKEEHIRFFDWLKKLCRERNADVLLVAGDIFDNPNPSAESQRVYYGFLREVTAENPDLQIVVIAGNHDSAARLEAPNPLLENMNISVRGIVKRNASGETDCSDLFVALEKNGKIEALCLAVPYLRQGDYPQAETYSESVSLMYADLYRQSCLMREPETALVVMGHLQTVHAEISADDGSERITGGLESVPVDIFGEKTDYVALGHLHRYQSVAGRGNVMYAGSPLPMSFVEKNYRQGVNFVVVGGGEPAKIERIAFDPPVKLLSIPSEPKPADEVLKEIAMLPDGETGFHSPYLELKILMTEPDASVRYRIEEALKGKPVKLAHIMPVRNQARDDGSLVRSATLSDIKTMNPVDVAEDVYFNRYKTEMPENLKNLLRDVIKEIENEG